MESLKHLSLIKIISSTESLKPFGNTAFDDTFTDENKELILDILALDKSKDNTRPLFHFLKYYPEAEREKIISYLQKHKLFTEEIRKIRYNMLLPRRSDDYCSSLKPEHDAPFSYTEENYCKFVAKMINDVIDIVLPMECPLPAYEYLTEFFNNDDIVCLISEDRKNSGVSSLFHLVATNLRKAVIVQHIQTHSTEIPRIGDAVYGISVEGEGIKELTLQYGSFNIETLSEPDNEGIWRFKSFSNIITCLPLPLIAMQINKRGLFISGNIKNFKMIYHIVQFNHEIRHQIAVSHHNLPLPSGKILEISGDYVSLLEN